MLVWRGSVIRPSTPGRHIGERGSDTRATTEEKGARFHPTRFHLDGAARPGACYREASRPNVASGAGRWSNL